MLRNFDHISFKNLKINLEGQKFLMMLNHRGLVGQKEISPSSLLICCI
uniref:Uncharacterized protein n=1 Tax=Rhizophora mucronata TaxID=61149 RepID=A0A2P2R003_RHIMU